MASKMQVTLPFEEILPFPQTQSPFPSYSQTSQIEDTFTPCEVSGQSPSGSGVTPLPPSLSSGGGSYEAKHTGFFLLF